MNFRDFFMTHSWWGKLLGAFFGYLIAGPIGALMGVLVGNFFDRGLAQHFSNPHWLYHSEKTQEIQKKFFETTFFAMGYIAKSDGRVSEKEINMAKLLMSEMRLSNEQKKQAKQLFNEGKTAMGKLETRLNQLKNSCLNNHELLQLFIDIQYRAAQVDGLNANKIQALNIVISGLGFAPLNRQHRFYEDFTEPPPQQKNQSYQRPSSHTSQLHHAYALLGISPGGNKQELKKAYRRAMSQNHPDKLIAKGLPQEMINLANDKTQKIIKAYQFICEKNGW